MDGVQLLWIGKDSLLFTTKSPGVPGTHLIDLGKIKGYDDFWTWDPYSWYPGIDTFLTDITTPIAFYDNFASNGENSKVYPNARDFCIKFLMEQI